MWGKATRGHHVLDHNRLVRPSCDSETFGYIRRAWPGKSTLSCPLMKAPPDLGITVP